MARRKKSRGSDKSASVGIEPRSAELQETTPEPEGSSETKSFVLADTVIEIAAGPDNSESEEVRYFDRRKTDFPVVVQFRESVDDHWKEETMISTFSRNGAAITLAREVPIGRLVSMVIQAPPEIRLYDYNEPVYLMLAVVQNCFRVPGISEKKFNVGLAFIGKSFPASFNSDPTQTYRLTGMTDDGLWMATEAASPFQIRKHSRFWRQFSITITVRDESTRTSRRAEVVTRDISAGGMSFVGDVLGKVGDRVKVVIPETDYFTIATIRNISKSSPDDDSRRVFHLEFDRPDLPIDLINGGVPDTEGSNPQGPAV